MDNIKNFLITMGVGFAIGAMVTASNKKVMEVAKQAKQMAEEKCEMIKDGVVSAMEKIEENKEEKTENQTLNTKNNKKQSIKA